MVQNPVAFVPFRVGNGYIYYPAGFLIGFCECDVSNIFPEGPFNCVPADNMPLSKEPEDLPDERRNQVVLWSRQA